MEDESTCGQGLAEHALIPELISGLMNATADNLIAHLSMLVASDSDTQHERSVYEHLSSRHREAAALLDVIATEMRDHRTMRMGQHDVEAMSHDDVTGALERLVGAEARLVEQLGLHLVDHRAMVDELGL